MLNPQDISELSVFEVKMLENLRGFIIKLKIKKLLISLDENSDKIIKLKAVKDICKNNLLYILTSYRKIKNFKPDNHMSLDEYLEGIFNKDMVKNALNTLIVLKSELNLENDIITRSIDILKSFED